MAKMPQERFTTPIATLVWPHVHAPDTKFDDEGVYSTEFTLTREEAQPLIDLAKKLIAEAKKQKLAKSPNKAPYTENDDGTVTFRAKSKHQPALFDSRGTPMAPGVKVGGGTRARVAGLMRVYESFGHTGVTLYLNALQIIDLKEFGSGDAASFGFDAVEGFTVDSLPDVPVADPLEDDGESNDNDYDDFSEADF